MRSGADCDGEMRRVEAGMERSGGVGHGGDGKRRHGNAGAARAFRRGTMRHGKVTQAAKGTIGTGELRSGRQGKSGLSSGRMTRRVGVRQARQKWKGRAWSDVATQARFNFNYSLTIFLMAKKSYVYKKTAFVRRGVKAQDAGEELERISKEHGEVTPPLVVDEARPEESPIHEVFEWDDYVAAESHREHQARQLIRSIQVVKPEGNTEPVFIHIHSEQAYLPTKTVVNDVDFFAEAKRSAEKRLQEASASLNQLKSIAKRGQKQKVQTAINFLSKAQDQLVE